MMEKENTITAHGICVLRIVQAPKQFAVSILDNQWAAESLLTEDLCKNCGIISLSTGYVHHRFVS